jgi:hypothetical protein
MGDSVQIGAERLEQLAGNEIALFDCEMSKIDFN